jgi:hypothetical protein
MAPNFGAMKRLEITLKILNQYPVWSPLQMAPNRGALKSLENLHKILNQYPVWSPLQMAPNFGASKRLERMNKHKILIQINPKMNKNKETILGVRMTLENFNTLQNKPSPQCSEHWRKSNSGLKI